MSDTAVGYTVRVLPELRTWSRFWAEYHRIRGEYVHALTRLQDDASPMSFDEIARLGRVADQRAERLGDMSHDLALAEAIVALAEAVQALAAGDAQTAQVIASSIIASSKPS